jgi:hypothetical protein
LILKDETATVIKRFQKRNQEPISSSVPPCGEPSSSTDGSPSADNEQNLQTLEDVPENPIMMQSQSSPPQGYPQIETQLSPFYEANQVALYCCRATVNVRTLSWIMADDKWIDILPEMMGRSEALTSAIHANASTYLARTYGANVTPRQALTHYSYALKELQRDLYDPLRQTSDETLFAIILLGVFDVSCLP